MVTVALLSISCGLCPLTYPQVFFCCRLGIYAISVKLVLITGALHGLRFHELELPIRSSLKSVLDSS
jgi:hypothetical protein